MKKELIFSDGKRFTLSPLTYDEFVKLNLWDGGSDSAWNRWCWHNGYVQLGDYKPEYLRTARIKIDLAAVLDPEFNLSGDDMTWVKLSEVNFG